MTEQSADIGELVAALASVQASMRAAGKNTTNPHLGSKYADLKSVVFAFQPELGQAGLAIIQTCEHDNDATFVATTLGHKSGQWIRGRLKVETSLAKGLNLAQSQGLAITYARRYSMAAIVAVVTEDNDGHGAGDPPPARPNADYLKFLDRCAKAEKLLGGDTFAHELQLFGIADVTEVAEHDKNTQTQMLNAFGAAARK